MRRKALLVEPALSTGPSVDGENPNWLVVDGSIDADRNTVVVATYKNRVAREIELKPARGLSAWAQHHEVSWIGTRRKAISRVRANLDEAKGGTEYIDDLGLNLLLISTGLARTKAYLSVDVLKARLVLARDATPRRFVLISSLSSSANVSSDSFDESIDGSSITHPVMERGSHKLAVIRRV